MEIEIEILPKDSRIPRKLSPAQTKEVITMCSQMRVEDIAARFGVTRSTIDRIRKKNVKNITKVIKQSKTLQGPDKSYSDDEW